MRSFTHRAVGLAFGGSSRHRAPVVGLGLVAAVLWSGCEAKQATEYVTGISTQVSVPRDLKSVRVEVNSGGFQTFCQGYKVYDGKVQLPRSLGSYPGNEGALNMNLPITYTIVGLTQDFDPASTNPLFAICDRAKIGSDGARILRRSRQPYVPDEIRFLPMPLKYACYDKQCDGDDMTCKGGKCVSAIVVDPAKTLPLFTPDLVDGTGGTCFSVNRCYGMGFPAVVADSETCTYAVAATASAPPPLDPKADPFRPACTVPTNCPSNICTEGRCEPFPAGTPWDGVNVEIVYDGGVTRELLDIDPEEGFFIPDPTKPQRFRLAEGLCEMVKGRDAQGNPTAHRITAVRASGTCRAKTIDQPFCKDDQLNRMGIDPDGTSKNPNAPDDCKATELKPPRAALMVVVDNTAGHANFFNAEELKAVDAPLRDPAFERTDIGLVYSGGPTCAPNAAPAIPLEAARTVREKLINSFLGFANPANLVAGNPSFEGGLQSSYGVLSALPNDTYFRRAVIVLGNRDFNVEQCGGIPGTPVEVAQAARTTPSDPTKPINTYVIQLVKTNPAGSIDDPLDPGVFSLASAGSATPLNPDARGNKKNAKDAFQQVINTLATCVYDVDDNATAPAPTDTVSFTDPLQGTTTKIASNAGCDKDDAPGSGWGYGTFAPPGKKRIHLCADSCAGYRSILASASDFTLLYQQPPLAVPMFSHRAACEPK